MEMKKIRDIWKAGIFGAVAGDALGCPVQFESRDKVATHPVTGMRGYGTFNLPAGSWTDDSSLTLALLSGIADTGSIDLKHIMNNFVDWLEHGAFTPYGYAYDIGFGTESAILNYERGRNPLICGGTSEQNNGNGSLMRIMPACLYCCAKRLNSDEAIQTIHAVGSLTHAHIRANIACGLYYFMTDAVLNGEGSLTQRLQAGLDKGFAYYEKALTDPDELKYYDRLRDLSAFRKTPAEEIQGSGYVVETIEAVVWTLITTDAFEKALLQVVNLGRDTDTTGAIAGGLAALYYGYDAIPEAWVNEIQRKEWIEELCEKAEQAVK